MANSGEHQDKKLHEWLERKRAKEKQPEGAGKRNGLRKVPLKRGSELKKTKLNPVSKKQKKRLQEYEKAKEKHYKHDANRVCAICGSSNNLSIHHKSKRGSNIASDLVTLCLIGNYLSNLHPELNPSSSGCHGFVEANKGWARENGWLL